MSIAMDEANERYPRYAELSTTRENNICRRTGYIDGRTAEVTDAETNAAAMTIWRIEESRTDEYCARAWESLSPARRGTYIVIAGMALEAARQAVTG